MHEAARARAAQIPLPAVGRDETFVCVVGSSTACHACAARGRSEPHGVGALCACCAVPCCARGACSWWKLLIRRASRDVWPGRGLATPEAQPGRAGYARTLLIVPRLASARAQVPELTPSQSPLPREVIRPRSHQRACAQGSPQIVRADAASMRTAREGLPNLRRLKRDSLL